MWIRLRQIAVVGTDLHRVGLDIATVFGVEACYCDPGVGTFGLKNTLWPIGSQFLEVVTPVQDDTAAGRYVARRAGAEGAADTGYMVITQVDDAPRRRERAAELGVRIAFELSEPAKGHDGFQLHPADTGGSFLEMDQMTSDGGDEPGGPWYPAGPYWQPYVRTELVDGISAAELQSPDPDRLAARWAEIIEIDLVADDHGRPTIPLENATLRFVADEDGRGEGLGGIDVVVNDREAVLSGAEARGCAVSDDQVAVAGLRVYLR